MKSYCLLIADEMDGEVDFDLPGKVLLHARGFFQQFPPVVTQEQKQ